MDPPASTATLPSGLLKAGTILLLIGSILQTVGAILSFVLGIFLLFSSSAHASTGTLGLVLGVLLFIGSSLAHKGWNQAKAGRARVAWRRGLVASLLPPLQLVTFIGALLCMASPEGEAQKADSQ